MLITSFLTLAAADFLGITQLGVSGVTVMLLWKLLGYERKREERSNKSLEDTRTQMMLEINTRDKRYIELQEKTLTIVNNNTNALEKLSDQLRE